MKYTISPTSPLTLPFPSHPQVFTGIKDNAQSDIFRDSKHLVMSVVDGYNVCIFAYGQTGSGKTFTMIGGCSIEESVKGDGEFHEDAGIAPRAVSELFRLLNERNEQVAHIKARPFTPVAPFLFNGPTPRHCQSTFTVDVTMFQIYRDGLQDLLKGKKKQAKSGGGGKGKKATTVDADEDEPESLKITLAQHSDSGLVTVDGAVVQVLPNPPTVSLHRRIFANKTLFYGLSF